MKKCNFVTLVLGTVSGLLFSLGMCMALLPEWDAFLPGVLLGVAGLLLGLIALLIRRKMTNKPPVRLTRKGVLAAAVGILSALLLGVGMCCCMVWENLLAGILIGILGIVGLLCLIPLLAGLKD